MSGSSVAHGPRFYVSEFRGWPIYWEKSGLLRHGRPSGRSPAPLLVSVHDRVYCHRTIRTYESRLVRFGRLTRAQREARVRRQAADLAAALNAKHETLLNERGPLGYSAVTGAGGCAPDPVAGRDQSDERGLP